jgi:hypothetical protein
MGSIVSHHPVLTDATFATVQFLIGLGSCWKRTRKPALGLSGFWALAVWWFGEAAGAVFRGRATPFAGGPGGVLFYALLAVVLWPSEGPDRPFVAARSVGAAAAKALWVAVWTILAVLSVVGSGRSPGVLRDLVANVTGGQPDWLTHVDRATESLFLHHGPALATAFAAICVVVAFAVFLPPRATRSISVFAVGLFAVVWVAVQNLGGILAGGATDPNSGPLLIVFVLLYWPIADSRLAPTSAGGPKATITARVSDAP